MFDDPTEKTIEFSPIQIWQIGEDNKIEYTVPNGYEEAESDWIGVFKVCIKHIMYYQFLIEIAY